MYKDSRILRAKREGSVSKMEKLLMENGISRVAMVTDPRVPSMAEWSKALESDASASGESPVRALVRAATLCPYA